MGQIIENDNGLKTYIFDDGTTMHSTTNELKDLLPGRTYFVMGNEKVCEGGVLGIMFKWFECAEICEDERYQTIHESMASTGKIEYTGRVKVISNDGHALVLEWLHEGNPRQTHYYTGAGVTVVAGKLN